MVAQAAAALREQGIAAAYRGDRAAAQAALEQAVRQAPHDADSWYWLAAIQPDPRVALIALEHALAADPQHERARAGYVAVRAQLGLPPPVLPARPRPGGLPWEESPPAPAPSAPPPPAPLAVAPPPAARVGALGSASAASFAPPLPAPAGPPIVPAAGLLAQLGNAPGTVELAVKVMFAIAALVVGYLVLNQMITGGVGMAASDFKGTEVYSGQEITMASLRGQPVWVNFWASWCPPCREEMPAMQARYNKLRAEGLVILGVDVNEDGPVVQDFVGDYGYNWTFLIDTSRASRAFRVSSIPHHVFIDRNGVVQGTRVGALSGSTMDTYLAKIMGK